MASNDKTGPDDGAAEGSWSPRGNDVTSTKATDDSSSSKGSSKGSSGGGSPDPDQLVADIERTRENLAETLDAIVEKVNPKRVVEEKKQQAKADAQEAVKTAKTGAANAAQSVKAAVKDGVASVKEKIGGDEDPVRSPLTPKTSVEVGAAVPVASPPPTGTGTTPPAATGSPLPADTVSIDAAAVPPEPAPVSDGVGSYAVGRPAVARTEPAGAGTAPYFGTLPPAVASNAPLIGGVGASVALLLLLVKKRRSRSRRNRVARGRRS